MIILALEMWQMLMQGKEKIILNDHIQGDPLHENNLECVLNLVNKIRLLLPDKTIWLYTGYTLEECLSHDIRKEIVSKCNIIVDGEFIEELKDNSLYYRGSKNQNVWENRNGEWYKIYQ